MPRSSTALETNVGGVVIQAANGALIGIGNGRTRGLNESIATSGTNAVNGHVGLSESGGRGQSGNCQSDNFLCIRKSP